MKQFLLVVATEDELHSIRRECPLKSSGMGENFVFTCEKPGYKIYVIQGGIGKAAMAFRLGFMMAHKKFDLVLNTGVAGSFGGKLKAFDALCATRAAYYDVSIPGLPFGQMARMPLYYECDPRVLEACHALDADVKEGLILTADFFATKDNLPKDLEEKFDNPMAIDMESAAVGEACKIQNIPFGILRTISDDTSEEGNAGQYERNLEQACDRASRLALGILDTLGSK